MPASVNNQFGTLRASSLGAAYRIEVAGSNIGAIEIIGDIRGDIKVTGTHDIGTIKTTGIDADITGTLETAAGEIVLIKTLGAGSDFLGTIKANPTDPVPNPDPEKVIPGGIGLNTLQIKGNIGAPGSPVAIESGGSITLIEAEAIYANIDAEKYDDLGNFRKLKTRTGDFVGTIKTDRMTSSTIGSGLFIAGTFDGKLIIDDIQNNIVNMGSLASGGHVSIDRALSEDWTFDANGLSGNIVIDADFDGTGGWAFTNNITVGTLTLTGAVGQDYLTPSASLGGGAIGIPPFKFHPVDCIPDHESVNSAVPSEITIEYYGPIVEKNAASMLKPFMIERAEWSDLPTGCTQAGCAANDPACAQTGVWKNRTGKWDYAMHPGGNTRRIRLTGIGTGGSFAFAQSTSAFSIPVNFVYRVRPRGQNAANTLLCDVNGDGTNLDRNGTAEPVVFRPGAGPGKAWQCDEGNYKFFVGSIQTLTTLDLNQNGVIGTGDMLKFANTPTDVNRDGVIEVGLAEASPLQQPLEIMNIHAALAEV